MVLRDKLHSLQTIKYENVASYLTHIAHVNDDLETVRDIVLDSELVRISLKGFTKN